jgi:hypothetical protein
MQNKIQVSKEVLLYVAEQLYVKAYSDGKKGTSTVNIESVVSKVADQFTKDVERFSLAKPIKQ